MLFFHETFLVYKSETFKNFKEVKHITIMIIAIIYIFLCYVIFDQQLRITFRKSSAPTPPEKIHSPLTHKKFKKCKSHLFAIIENFSGPLAEGGKDTDNDAILVIIMSLSWKNIIVVIIIMVWIYVGHRWRG